MYKTVLFFGTYPNPITGQSVSFKETYDNFNSNKILFDTSEFGNKKLFNSVYTILKLPYIFLFKEFDVIYFTCSRTTLGAVKDIYLLLLTILFKKKIVCHLHGADFIDFRNKNILINFIVEKLYVHIDKFIVLTNKMKEQFDFVHDDKIEIIENCFSSQYQNVRVNLNQKKNQILFLSNIIFSKGIFDFLDVSDKLLEFNPQVKIKIAGKFMQDENLDIQMIKQKFFQQYYLLKNKYVDRIFYLGSVDGNEKIKLLSESDIFVLPTFYKTEAFPISIIEAMRFGNSIITTNHNYLSDIISNSNGFLIEKKNSDLLYEAVQEMLGDKSKLRDIQLNNISISKNRYSPKSYNKKIKFVFDKLYD